MCKFWQDLKSFACLKCQSDKRKCSNIDLLKQLSAKREAATALDYARSKISQPEHINELGIKCETVIILGRILSLKMRNSHFHRKVEKSFCKIHQRLDTIEWRLGMGVDGETVEEGGMVQANGL